MKFIIIVVLFALLPGVFALQWSEIMFNPIGNDNTKEFVELVGTENLQGCTIRDTSSADILILNHTGNDVIMIVESDSTWLATNATTYTIGSAIGNGLGNSYEELTISCNNTTLLYTSYNISLLQNFTEGKSITYKDEWIVGEPTPGSHKIEEKPIKNEAKDIACNNSLFLTMSATRGVAGESISFTIMSDNFATYEASANGIVFAKGDTLTRKEHAFILPNTTQVKLAAYSESCEGKQRSVRYIIVDQPFIVEVKQSEIVAAKPIMQEERPIMKSNAVTGEVILDQDRSMVLWICIFGSITIIASSIIFLQLLRRGEH